MSSRALRCAQDRLHEGSGGRGYSTLKTYTRDQFFVDLIAGGIVGVAALPLAIAFAIASGVTPERRL